MGARKSKKCGKLFGDCSSTDCCALGCECVRKNKYFAQCQGEWGQGFCNWKLSLKKVNGSKEVLPKTKKEDERLSKERADTDKAAKEEESKAAKLHDDVEKEIQEAKSNTK